MRDAVAIAGARLTRARQPRKVRYDRMLLSGNEQPDYSVALIGEEYLPIRSFREA